MHADDEPSPEADRASGLLTLIWQGLKGAQRDVTTGSLRRAIVVLAVPMVLEMAMESVFAICDIYFVSRLGADAVAAVGLTESCLTLFYAVAFGLSIGTTALVARRVGEGDREAAARAGGQALWLGVTLSALIGVPCFLLAPQILELMGAEAGVIAVGSGYTAVLLGANVVIMLLFLNNAIFRGAGDAAAAMWVLWIANGINLVLDPCLIFGLGPFPEMGVTGAAVATTIGRGAGVLVQFLAYRSRFSRIRMSRAALRLRLELVGKLLRVSLGSIGQFLIGTASWVFLMRLVAEYGSIALAGYTVAVRIVIFALLPSWGLANAAATLVGQNLGAGKPERAARAVWLSGCWNMAFLGCVTILFVSLAPELVALLAREEGVRPVGAASLRIMSYGYIFYAWGMVLTQAFNGAGDTWTPTRINLCVYWLFQIPLAYGLARGLEMGPEGVFWAVAIAETALTVVAAAVFRRGHWKVKRI